MCREKGECGRRVRSCPQGLEFRERERPEILVFRINLDRFGNNYRAGVYILSLNFIIAPKRVERALKIFIFAPIHTMCVNAIF